MGKWGEVGVINGRGLGDGSKRRREWDRQVSGREKERAKKKKKITRRTIGAKGFNFLQERLDKKGLKGTTSLYLSITIYSLSSIIYCYYLSLSSNMCF